MTQGSETYTVTVRTQDGRARSVQRYFKQTADEVLAWRGRTRLAVARGSLWTVNAVPE